MRLPSSLRPWRLESLALLSIYSTVVLAQGDGNNDEDEDQQDDPDPRPTNPPAAPTNGNNDDDNNNDDADQETSSPRNQTPTRTASTQEERSTSTSRTTAGPVPSITGGESGPLPTLSNANDYSYPPPAVPPTINAPFMDRSTMPSGTVFIAVGAILGTFGLAVLIWRAIVACLLHRSVARAAAAQHLANEKSTHLAPPAAFHKSSGREPSPGRGARRTNRGPIPSGTPSQSNLFFSPTAAGTAAAANRDSRYLPSGFYAAGSSPSPALGSHSAVGYSTLRPDSRGQQVSRNTMRDHSPEGSPQYAARQGDPSMSSLNLNQAPSQRAPSAYLEDLLDENPHMFPPAQMPQTSRHHHNHSHSSQGRR